VRCLIRLLLIVVLLAAACAGVAVWLARGAVLETQHGDYSGGPKAVEIAPGMSAQRIFEKLEAAGVLSDARIARAYFVLALDEPSLQAGEYEFSEPLTVHDTIDKLVRGDVVTHPVTIVEGLTADETAVALASAGFGDVELFRAEISSPERIADLDPDAGNLEGYLYPDTYRFANGTTEAEIVSSMVDNFRRRVDTELSPLLEAADRSLRDLVTLASIIEKEAKFDEERPIISAVYNNRLERGIALYADPTIIYALKLAGTWDGDIRRRDLSLESPYNTYRVAVSSRRASAEPDLLASDRQPRRGSRSGRGRLSVLRQ